MQTSNSPTAIERDLARQIAAFLDRPAASRAPDDGSAILRRLLEDSALAVLLLHPPPESIGWLAACRAVAEASAGSVALAPDVVARCHLAIAAAELSFAERLTSQQGDTAAASLARAIEALKGNDRAFAICHLIAGHLALNAAGPRLQVISDAQHCFKSAGEIRAGGFVDAFSKLRCAEVSLLTPEGIQQQTVIVAQDAMSDALETLAETDAPSIHTGLQLDAEIRAGIGLTAYLLLSPTDADSQTLDLSIATLTFATRQPYGLKRGGLRWAKAMLTLAGAWDTLATQYAVAPVPGDQFGASLDKNAATLQEICDYARSAAPEVWANAHLLLAIKETELPSETIEDQIERIDLAQGVFTRQLCPEIWWKLETNRASIVLNHSRLHRDQGGIQTGLHQLEHATEIDDPLRDTLRNGYRRLARELLNVGRADLAIIAFERAIAAAEFVVARAYTAEAQRAEFSLLAQILKELAEARLKFAGVADAIPTLIRGIELDFAYSLVLAPDPQRLIEGSERTARLVLGTTALERRWYLHLPFGRTEAEISAERLDAGRTLADIVEAATGKLRRQLDERIARIRPERLIPPGGALVLALTTNEDATFFVLTGGSDGVMVEAVPSPYASRSMLSERLYGTATSDGWMYAYAHSLADPGQPTKFGGHPAILKSRGGGLHVTFLPSRAEDPAGMTPKETWITALDGSMGANWDPFEPLHAFIKERLEPGAPVVLTGEPLLSMIPLAGAWRHEGGVAREIIDDWSLGLAPSLAALPTPGASFRIGARDAALVYVDQTGTLLFSEWEQVALVGTFGRPNVRVLGGRRRITRDAVIEALCKSAITHIACHAHYEHTDPRDSAIRLSDDNVISAVEITRLDLSRTKLVVLSACESGMINTQIGTRGRYAGLATAFLEAGAERVIASLWRVNDCSTLLLMDNLYRELLSAPPIRALRNAMMSTRDSTAAQVVSMLRAFVQRAVAIPSSPLNRPKVSSLDPMIAYFEKMPPETRPFHSPYYWAGFVHYGAPV